MYNAWLHVPGSLAKALASFSRLVFASTRKSGPQVLVQDLQSTILRAAWLREKVRKASASTLTLNFNFNFNVELALQDPAL